MTPVPGTRVRSRHNFVDAPSGTQGIVVEDYDTGFMVAWNLPGKPIPDLPLEEIAEMWAINPLCPLRDGFDKATETGMLDYLIDDEWVEGPEYAEREVAP